MTSRLRLLLAATCALALIQLASGQTKCASDSWGASSGTGAHSWSSTILGPPTIAFAFPVSNPICPNPSGINAVACDHDVAPSVKISEDRRTVVVHRKGNAHAPGTIIINTVCN
ncbi:uncharacterized protein LOC142985298 isoform X1 [Anticarsia gemmatalis]|uniref:uncharacterized protein LOC142985298 isoform X1 n=1 Tax=Anticarsia gemmatalis TaxID=129554 RepID=UPI003F760909